MSVFNNIFNGMARGFAFGTMGLNPFFGSCCCNINPLFYTPNPFMGGGFFPIMPQISMPIFNFSSPTYCNIPFGDMTKSSVFDFDNFSLKDMFDRANPFKYSAERNFDNYDKSREDIDENVDVFIPSKKKKEKKNVPDQKGKYLDTNNKYYTEMRDFIIRELEGGYSDIKGDRGGKTYKGVTENTYNMYRKKWGKPTQSIKKITDEEVDKIYHSIYIEAEVDKITNPRLALYVFAQAVNSGPSVAKELLKKSGGNIDRYEQLQRARYNRLANGKDQEQFRRGWQNRVTKTKDFAMNKLPENMDVSTA